MVSDLHCLLDKLYSVNKPVVTGKNVNFIKWQKIKSNEEKSFVTKSVYSWTKLQRQKVNI